MKESQSALAHASVCRMSLTSPVLTSSQTSKLSRPPRLTMRPTRQRPSGVHVSCKSQFHRKYREDDFKTSCAPSVPTETWAATEPSGRVSQTAVCETHDGDSRHGTPPCGPISSARSGARVACGIVASPTGGHVATIGTPSAEIGDVQVELEGASLGFR